MRNPDYILTEAALVDLIRDPMAKIPYPRFELERLSDPGGVSGTGAVAEGYLLPDGTAVVLWLTKHPGLTIHRGPKGLQAVRDVHGHGGQTLICWPDYGPVGLMDGRGALTFEDGEWCLRLVEDGHDRQHVVAVGGQSIVTPEVMFAPKSNDLAAMLFSSRGALAVDEVTVESPSGVRETVRLRE